MNEKQLGEALLKWDASQPSLAMDPRPLTDQVLRRDRRRVQWLTVLTVLLWLIAAVLIVAVLTVSVLLILPRLEHWTHQIAAGQATELQDIELLFRFVYGFTETVALCIAVAGLAALSTVVLVFTSRRATLRQVNASLVEISEQLKQFRVVAGK